MFSALLCAQNIELSLKNSNGNSLYIVEKPSQNLKAKLSFPFDFYTIDLAYSHHFNFFDLKASSSFLLNHKTTIGKDYDWQNDNLTLFSKSDNKVDRYYDFALEISKNIFDDLKVLTRFNYKILDMYWSNTHQEDFVKNETSYHQELTLKYQQKFYKYNLGLNYQYEIYRDILIEFEPSLVYAFIESKDTHVSRNFYTLQNSQAFGYKVKFNTIYKINSNSKIKLSFYQEALRDKSVDMNYYNILNKKYKTLPSSYKYKNSTICIGYIYSL